MLHRFLSLGLALALVGCDDEPELADDPDLAVPGTEVPQDPPPPQPGDLPPGYRANSEFSPALTVPGHAPMPEPPAPPMPPGMAGAPPGGMAPGGAPLTLAPGFQPQPRVAGGVIVAGPIDAQTMGNGCVGFVGRAPSHLFTLSTSFRYLRILVRSSQDTVLVVRGPDGVVRCNDDYDPAAQNYNPLIEGALGPGAYQVFVGGYQSGVQGQYAIAFTENPQVQHAHVPLTPPAGAAPTGAAPAAQTGRMQPMVPSR